MFTPVLTRLSSVRIPTRACTLNCFAASLEIKTSILNKEVINPSVREAVGELLHPNPKLGDFIERQCSRESWQGIITRLWPNSKYIDVIVTATMAQYIPTLDYYNRGLPLVCTMYTSSECYFGLNLKPLCKPSEVSYTLLPNMAYFEFLHVHQKREAGGDMLNSPKTFDEKERRELVELVDVKLGQEYELVVTTYASKVICTRFSIRHFFVYSIGVNVALKVLVLCRFESLQTLGCATCDWLPQHYASIPFCMQTECCAEYRLRKKG